MRSRTTISDKPAPRPGVSASLDLTHNFVEDAEHNVCAAIFMNLNTWHMAIFPMKSKACSEFVRVLKLYKALVRDTFHVDLRDVQTDNDPCYTDNRGVPCNVLELQSYLDTLPVEQSIVFTHSPPGYQALNPVECAVRQLYHLMNFYLEQGHLSLLCWVDMARAAVYVMNRLPHPQSKDRRRQAHTAYELATGQRPDLSDLIAGPGELVVADFLDQKASAGVQTGEQCYYIHPVGAGHLVRSFRTGLVRNTRSVRAVTAGGDHVAALVSLRHAIQTGRFRDGSGLEGGSCFSGR